MVFIAALLVAGALPQFTDILILESSAVRTGQWWRLFTASFVHLSWSHASINVLALLLLLAWAKVIVQFMSALLFILIAPTFLSLVLLALGFDWYAGLSAILHGLVLFLLLQMPGGLRVAGILLLLAKLGWQFLGFGDQHSGTDVPVLHQAHWVGVALGLLFHHAVKLRVRYRKN